MPERPLPAWHNFHRLGITGVMLGAVLVARSAEIPPGDAPRLVEEQTEALREHKTTWAWNRGYGIPPIPLRLMPDKVEFEAGKLSLVPDLLDSEEGRIAIYLINATDEKVEGIDPNSPYCFLEVKDGNRWRACERFLQGCATDLNFPNPAGLKGKTAAIFFGTDPRQGDLSGELRFCSISEGVRPIVSASFQGRYSSKQFKAATPSPMPASEDVINGLTDMVSGKADGGSQQGNSRSPEEYIAAAELDRCYDGSNTTRALLVRWQADTSSAECRTALTELLQRPWDHQLDAPALFERCFTALTRRDAKQPNFGSPERCRAMVWSYLSGFRSEWRELMINPERWDQLKKIKQSGNPWGVDDKLLVALVGEAITSLQSTDSSERHAAGAFLNGYWITEKHLPDEQCRFLLDQGVANLRTAAVAALASRGKSEQAGKWLVNHPELPPQELFKLWTEAARFGRKFADWELAIGLRLLEISPLETVSALSLRRTEIGEGGVKHLPIELREPIRRLLLKEAEEKRLVGLPMPESVEAFADAARATDSRRSQPGQLKSALRILASWEDPSDTPLIRSYLTHPAAEYMASDQQILCLYDLRSTVVDILKERHEEIPQGVIFEEKIPTK